MKNIHILPTDKTSRLQSNRYSKLFLSEVPKAYADCINQNIYITSDEEIKEGDLGTDGTLLGYYGFDEDGCPILKNTKNNKVYEFGLAPYAKKIILTDNQELIKDGVQAIDDEFLEWFVNNPSCEWVDVKGINFVDSKIGIIKNHRYKIIIPKEEKDYTALLKPIGTKQTAMQDLREDLILTQTSAKEALLEIENKETRKACQEVVKLTLNNIIKRIDDELLEMEKQQIIDAFYNGDCNGTFETINSEQYYNETFNK